MVVVSSGGGVSLCGGALLIRVIRGKVLKYSFMVGLSESYLQPAAYMYANAVSGFIACIGGRKSNAAQLKMESV